MSEAYDFSEDEALKEEASLEIQNSENPFVEYEVSYEFIKECTERQLALILN